MNKIAIYTEYITLGQLLKIVDLISSGGMAKAFLATYDVWVDDELENRRGRKLYPGMKVHTKHAGPFFIIADED